jgi:hypothetical protein
MSAAAPTRTAVLAGATAVAVWSAVWVVASGPQLSVDSRQYGVWADGLIAAGFRPTYFGTQPFTAPLWTYSIWIALVAVAKVAVGAAWPWAVVAVNWAAVAGVARRVLEGVATLTGATAAVAGAALLFAVSPDVLLFVRYALTDTLFMALSGIVVVTAVRRAAGHVNVVETAVSTVAVIAACFVRPAAAPLVGFWCVAWLLTRRQAYAPARMIAVLAIGLACGVVAHGYFITHPDVIRVAAVQAWIAKVHGEYAQGMVVFGRPDTYIAPATTMAAAVRLTLWKWVLFFAPWLPGYSVPHALLNVVFFACAYLLCARAVVRSPHRGAIAVLIFYVAVVSVFYAMQEIDYDHRYRLPIVPALVLCAGLGIAAPTRV